MNIDRVPAVVIDARGTEHRITHRIGGGGQGAVYATERESIAVKLVIDTSPEGRQQVEDQLAKVRLIRAKVPDFGAWPIARPLEALKPPHVGYVMQLLTGMDTLNHLMFRTGQDPPLQEWYRQNGGLRRRLRLLAHAAEIFARLHSYSLVYSDPSPPNILVSKDLGRHEVYLIDVDNLRFESAPGRTFYTRSYGAPEIVNGASGTTMSDVHAFAVIAYFMLVRNHPLIGDLVFNSEAEEEDRALSGEYPWIDHPVDTSNHSSKGWRPREAVLNRRLRDLFHRTFGPGLNNPLRRPRMMAWMEFLHAAADNTLICPKCELTYYLGRKDCPWCDAPRPPFTLATVRRWYPAEDGTPGMVVNPAPDKPNATFGLQSGHPYLVTARIARAWTGLESRQSSLKITVIGRRIEIEVLDGDPDLSYWVTDHAYRSPRRFERMIAMPDSSLLHFGPLDQPHRLVAFELQPEVKSQ